MSEIWDPTILPLDQGFVDDLIQKVLSAPKSDFKLEAIRPVQIFRGYHELFSRTQCRPEFIVFGQDVLDALLRSDAIRDKDFTFIQTYMHRDTKRVTLFGMSVICDWHLPRSLIPDNTIAFVAMRQDKAVVLRTCVQLPF